MSSTWETPGTETEEQIEERRHIVSDTVRRLEKLAQNWTAAELRGDTTYLPRERPDRRLRRHRATRFHADQGPVTPSLRVREPAVRVLRAGRDGGALLERVMNLGGNRIEMRIPRSDWFPRDLRFPHS